MDKEQRAMEFEILVNNAHIICIDVQGMRWENEQRLLLGYSIAYDEKSFIEKTQELEKVNHQLENLKYVT